MRCIKDGPGMGPKSAQEYKKDSVLFASWSPPANHAMYLRETWHKVAYSLGVLGCIALCRRKLLDTAPAMCGLLLVAVPLKVLLPHGLSWAPKVPRSQGPNSRISWSQMDIARSGEISGSTFQIVTGNTSLYNICVQYLWDSMGIKMLAPKNIEKLYILYYSTMW